MAALDRWQKKVHKKLAARYRERAHELLEQIRARHAAR
jgi:hypothetical protein